MERLTKQYNGVLAFKDGDDVVADFEIYTNWKYRHTAIMNLIGRLNQYEDILFTPDGTPRVTLDRLAELVTADCEVRCKIHPCKVGDTVWSKYGDPWTVTRIEHCLNGRTVFRCGHKGTEDYTSFFNEDIGEDMYLTEQEGNAAKERQAKKDKAWQADVQAALERQGE